jgi:predicted dehydrogenase
MMRQDAIRAGVIGVGTMGERHARLYAQSSAAELVGVYDADRARASAIAARWGTRAFDTAEQLLDAVQAISIASPTFTHAACATAALDRGINMLVEKPLADSLGAAREFAACASRRPEIVVQVGHIERFNPVVREVQRLVQGRRILSMTMRRFSLFDGRCLDSDVIQDLMVHDLDLAHAFCGNELELLGASGDRLMTARIDDATAHLRAWDGARLTLRASRVADRKVRALTVLTEDTWVDADLLNKSIIVASRVAGGGKTITERRVVAEDEPLRREQEYLLDCVRRRRQSPIGVEAGVQTRAHAEAIAALIDWRAAARSAELVAAGGTLAADD